MGSVHDPGEDEANKLECGADECVPEEGKKGTRGKAIDDDTALSECKRGLKRGRKED
jgi:hypothetical protein